MLTEKKVLSASWKDGAGVGSIAMREEGDRSTAWHMSAVLK